VCGKLTLVVAGVVAFGVVAGVVTALGAGLTAAGRTTVRGRLDRTTRGAFTTAVNVVLVVVVVARVVDVVTTALRFVFGFALCFGTVVVVVLAATAATAGALFEPPVSPA